MTFHVLESVNTTLVAAVGYDHANFGQLRGGAVRLKPPKFTFETSLQVYFVQLDDYFAQANIIKEEEKTVSRCSRRT